MKAFYKIIIFGFCAFIIAMVIIKATKNSASKNLIKKTAAYSLHSNQLIASYLENQSEFEKKYVGEIIEVEGIVEEINNLNDTYTIILKSDIEKYDVICDMNQKVLKLRNQPILTGEKIKIKGICKGILKDVILLNCVVQ